MKTLYTVLASLFCTSLFAQPVLQQSNLPPFGFIAPVSRGSLVNPGSAGANQTWNFSAFNSDSIGSFTVMDPASAPYALSFDQADRVHRLIINGDTEYTYYILTPGLLEILGEGVNAGGGHNYLPNHKSDITFPYAFGDVVTDTWVQIGGLGGNTTRTYDAYGQITTPFGVYDSVVRQAYKSSNDLLTNYVWYRTDTIVPVFMIDSSNNRSVAFDYSVPTATGINQTGRAALHVLYPNPAADGRVTIANSDAIRNVTIADMTGRVIERVEITVNGLVDVSNLSKGVYTIRSEDRNGRSHSDKLVIQ